MKKLINVFVLIMLNVFLLAGSVNATLHTYGADVVISNDNGAILYNDSLNKETILKKGTKCYIPGKYYDDKEGYYFVSGIKYGDSEISGYIKKEDVSPTSEFIFEDGFAKNEDVRKVYVWQDDCYLFKGPHAVYDKALENKIPKGTILEYQYASIEENADSRAYAAYIYTTYEGQKGWVLIDKLAKIIPGKIMISKENAKLLKEGENIEDIFEETIEDLGITIPKYTELDIEYVVDAGMPYYDFWPNENEGYYYIHLKHTTYVRVTYNGISGWINGNDCAKSNINHEKFIIIDENATMQTVRGENIKIPFLEEIEYKYDRGRDFYIGYAGVSGWISENSIAFPTTEIESIKIGNKDGAKGINKKGETITIPYFIEIDDVLYEANNEKLVVIYNNEKVLLNLKDCMIEYGRDDNYFTNKEITMYKDKDVNSEVICKIPRYSQIVEKYNETTEKYSNEKNFYYVEYEGYKGWIYVDYGHHDVFENAQSNRDMIDMNFYFTKYIKEEFKIYLTPKDIQIERFGPPYDLIKTIPSNSKIAHIYTAEYGPEDTVEVFLYKNELYAINSIKEDEMQLIDTVDNKGLQEFLASEYGEEAQEQENIISGEKEFNVSGENEDINVQKDTSKQIAIIAVIVVGGIAVITFIILKIVNKRKNK